MSNLQRKPTTKVRSKVPCYCKKCNGKQVDPRTRQKHEEEENRIQAAISSFTKKRKEEEFRTSIHVSESGNSSKSASAASSQNLYDDDVVMIDSNHNRSDNDHFEKPTHIRNKRRRYNRFRKTNDTIFALSEKPNQQSDSSSDEEDFQLTDNFDDYKSDLKESFLNDDELFV